MTEVWRHSPATAYFTFSLLQLYHTTRSYHYLLYTGCHLSRYCVQLYPRGVTMGVTNALRAGAMGPRSLKNHTYRE